MRDIADEILDLFAAGKPFALALIIRTWSSAPRPIGTGMAIASDGSAIGSLSGGCVEGAVFHLAIETIADGLSRLGRYGVSDNDAFAAGLACGGELDVLVRRVDPTADETEPLRTFAAAVAAESPAGLTLVVPRDRDHPVESGRETVLHQDSAQWLAVVDGEVHGSLPDPDLTATAVADCEATMSTGTSGVRLFGSHGERLLTDAALLHIVHGPRPRMIVFGAIDYARSLAAIGRFTGFRVTICDARPVFATRKRFPEADEVIVSWPHAYLEKEIREARIDARTVIAVLTHDLRFDVPALVLALRSDAAYIGAMGSRRTTEERHEALLEAGLQEEELSRLRAPIGVDLDARTPETAAVSIMAEILQTTGNGSGAPLRTGNGPIHNRR